MEHINKQAKQYQTVQEEKILLSCMHICLFNEILKRSQLLFFFLLSLFSRIQGVNIILLYKNSPNGFSK